MIEKDICCETIYSKSKREGHKVQSAREEMVDLGEVEWLNIINTVCINFFQKLIKN